MSLVEELFVEQSEALSQQLKQIQLLESKQQLGAENVGESAITKVSVHKFGGSSLKSAAAINQVTSIIEQNCTAGDLVILSAMGNTTDLLFDLVSRYQQAQDNDELFTPDCTAVTAYQQEVIEALLPTDIASALITQLQDDIQRIHFLLSRSLAWETLNQDDIIAYGELWSTRVVCAALQHRGVANQRVDSRDFIHTAAQQPCVNKNSPAGAQIDWDKSQHTFDAWLVELSNEAKGSVAIVSGYIATNPQGSTTTLGRNGSDFSATIVAKLANAKMVYLWTDVNGVYSADPNLFCDTKVIPVLGLNEANALASLGSPVFHEKTLRPLQQGNIPIRIRNAQIGSDKCADSGEDKNTGTLILTQPVKWQGAKTLALKQSVCLFSIKWHNRLLVAEFNDQLASALAHQQIVSYCWLAEEGTLKFCVSDADQQRVEGLLAKVERSCQLTFQTHLSIISLVGSELLQQGKHLGSYFSLIQQSNKQVLHYHYDTNGAISAIVNDKRPIALVSLIHKAIFTNNQANSEFNEVFETTQNQAVINLVLLGYGNIGRKLTDILSQQLGLINSRAKSKIQLVAVANSTNYIFDAQGLELDVVDQALAASSHKTVDIEHSLLAIDDQQLAIVDVTASQDVANLYETFFSKGRDVISASKLGITLPHTDYAQLLQLAKSNHSQWLSNVTCGAGLPIQQSISDLVLSGDKINSVSGLFSGTLSWILNRYDGKTPFSSVVAQAKKLGLTEPDPRDDLSGKDVQRKLLIIARTMGLTLDLEQIRLTPLIPEHFLALSAEDFAAASDELDQYMQQKWQQANEQNMKLCYSGQLNFTQLQGELQLQEAEVGLSFRKVTDPLTNVSPADNIVVIHSDWHRSNPLIIRGPGAGINVTAAGIVADIIKLAS